MGNATTLVFKTLWRGYFKIMAAVLQDEQISLLCLQSPLPEDRENQAQQEIAAIQYLQQNINEKAKFAPCSNHSLNLCSVHASIVNASATTFFSSSNYWWEVLSSHIMKRLLSTHYKTIHAVKTEFQGVIQALDSLTSASENLQTRGYIQIISFSIENFFMSHLFYWEEILG